MMPTKQLKAGDKVDIRLSFEGAPRLPVTFTVRRADGRDGMDHRSHAGPH
jgi:copper(I)-binding protein